MATNDTNINDVIVTYSFMNSSTKDYNAVIEGEKRAYGGYNKSAAVAAKATAAAEKPKVKGRVSFSPEQDAAILSHFKKHGNTWAQLKEKEPALFANRTSKAIGNRYVNHLSPEAQLKKSNKRKSGASANENGSTKKKKTTKKKGPSNKGKETKAKVTNAKKKTNESIAERKKKTEWDSEMESDSDDKLKGVGSDSDEEIVTKTAASRGDRAKRRANDKENRLARNLVVETMH